MSGNEAGKIFWVKEGPMLRSAQVAGLRLVVGGSWQRWACTRRWGWAIYDLKGSLVASSNPMRHGCAMQAMGGCVKYLRTYFPGVYDLAMRGG